jgi:hypothetical protein
MEPEPTDTNTESAKNTLTTVVKFNTVIFTVFTVIWALAALMYPHANSVTGLFGVGALLGLLTTISALNARLRMEWEEPGAAE